MFPGLNTVISKEVGTATSWITSVFYDLLFRLDFFVYVLIIAVIFYVRIYQLVGWEHFVVIYNCSKSKDEQMLYLMSFKIAADILNKEIF